MEKVNEKEILQIQVEFEREMEARIYMINAQIDSLEKLIESGKDKIRCPTCWNQVASLLDRLRYFVPAIWITAEESLNNVKVSEGGPGVTDMTTGEPKQPDTNDLPVLY